MGYLIRIALGAAAASLWLHGATAQTAATKDDACTIPNRERVDEGAVTIITAPAGGATSVFGSDMARVLDDDHILFVFLLSLGGGQSATSSISFISKAIDTGAVTADVPEFYRLQYHIPDIASRLRYIAKPYNNELHVVAPTSIKSIYDLQGKRIVSSHRRWLLRGQSDLHSPRHERHVRLPHR